jgi:DNA modification methylase
LKNKNLIGMPWRVAFALQDAGWYLRSEIIWHKPNPLPESVRDRPAKSHEQIFLLSKSAHYWYDADAVRQPVTGNAHPRGNGVNPKSRMNATYCRQNGSFSAAVSGLVPSRNLRDVWTVPTRGYVGAHFATFPPDLIRPCILAGCPVGGAVLDPFAGAGTTGLVALEEGRQFVGIELNPDYVQLARDRLEPLVSKVSKTTLSPYLEDLPTCEILKPEVS